MAEEVVSTQGQRNQTQGQRRRLKPRSKVWEHFTRHTGDDGNETAKCKRCGKVYAYHGTKNLWEHYNEGCGGQESADAGAAEEPPQALPSLAQDEEAMQQVPPLPPVPLPPSCAPKRNRELSGLQEEASKHLARMIALRGYDASVLEDDCFRSFVRSLNPEFEVPSRVTVENMCDGIFDEARTDLLDRLRRAPGKVNVAGGRAKTMEEEVFYVACHFIDDGWNLHKPVLHAIVTTDHHDHHDGPILGLHVCTYAIHKDVSQVISDLDIDNRLFMLAYETIDETDEETDEDIPLKYRLSFCTNRHGIIIYVDNVLHSIARCLITYKDLKAIMFDGINDLQLTRQERLELLAELDLHYGWAYEEHWYACYCCLKVLCKKGFPRGCTDADIVIINLLCNLWEKIYRAIQKISSSTRPTANLCLTELFKLRGILQPELERFSSADHGDDYNLFDDDKDVTSVLKEASDTLDKAIENSYLDWSLPLALDPRYKLEFISFNFERVYGLEAAKEYVSKVRAMITELYAEYVQEYGTTDGEDDEDGACHHKRRRSIGASME